MCVFVQVCEPSGHADNRGRLTSRYVSPRKFLLELRGCGLALFPCLALAGGSAFLCRGLLWTDASQVGF